MRFAFVDSDLLFSGFDGLTHVSGTGRVAVAVVYERVRGVSKRTATRPSAAVRPQQQEEKNGDRLSVAAAKPNKIH